MFLMAGAVSACPTNRSDILAEYADAVAGASEAKLDAALEFLFKKINELHMMPSDQQTPHAEEALKGDKLALALHELYERYRCGQHLDFRGHPYLDTDKGRKVLDAFYKMASKDPDQYPVSPLHSTSPR